MRESVNRSVWGLGVVAIAVPAAFAAFVGCKKETPVVLAESASALASVAPPATAKIVNYTIDAAGKTAIDMPGLNEHITATTDAAAGTLHVDVGNLANTRGQVKVDLTTLKTHTFKDDRDASQTTHALTWLEVGDATAAAVKATNQYAVFEIQSLDKISATDVTKVTPTKDGADDIRTITATIKAEFLVHGHKSTKEVPIEARFHYPAGAALDKPTRIDIKNTAPLRITLKEHDVHPRDKVGALAEWTTSLISKVAETADVTVDFQANLAQ